MINEAIRSEEHPVVYSIFFSRVQTFVSFFSFLKEELLRMHTIKQTPCTVRAAAAPMDLFFPEQFLSERKGNS